MKYYSTNQQAPQASLREAVEKGLAPDRGLYMPEQIKKLPQEFFDNIDKLSFQEIAFEVAKAFFGEDVEAEDLKKIVFDTLAFDTPVVPVAPKDGKGEPSIYALELFHGPTLAFKDVGARFMARLLQYFICKDREKTGDNRTVNVLVATSGDTGSAVANGFLGVDGIHVYVLYPKGKVSKIQESQFTTLGQNITALEVDGVFDDCQALVKSAFMDKELTEHMILTSANSINVARFLPQAFYYFNAYAQLKRQGLIDTTNSNVTALTTEVGKKTVSYAIQVTLTSAGWSGGAQTVSATHVTATNSVIVSPIPAHQDAYSTAGILCTEQAAGTLKFTCTSDPTANITVNVYIAE